MVCPSACRLSLKLLDEPRSHLAGTLLWSQVTLLDGLQSPMGRGDLVVDAAYCQIILALCLTHGVLSDDVITVIAL